MALRGDSTQRRKDAKMQRERSERRESCVGVEAGGGWLYGGIQRKGAKARRCKESEREESV